MRAFVAAVAASLLTAQPAHALQERRVPFPLGDDSGEWALDGECDDPRFSGTGMATLPDVDSIGRDATDCAAAFAVDTIEANALFAEPARPRDIVWGDDDGTFAGDGECDDMRFVGYAMPGWLSADEVGHDASDCRSLFVRGLVRWRRVESGG